MKISFACPSCGASGSADEAFVGRQVRCKPCQHRFVIPGPVESAEDAGYLLDAPTPGSVSSSPTAGAVFVPARGEEASVFVSPRKPKPTRTSKSRRERPEFAWRTWLIRGGLVAAVALAAVALIAPRGTVIVGAILLGLGALMVLIGFLAGAYGAFSEDFLYFFLYMAIPLYAGYYIVTRWDDLRNWFICSTVGFGFVLLGTEMLRRAGVAD
jgi:hypothetical protein